MRVGMACLLLLFAAPPGWTAGEGGPYRLDAVEAAVVEDLSPHSEIEPTPEMVNSYLRPLRLTPADRAALTRVLADELRASGLFKRVVRAGQALPGGGRPGVRLTLYALWYARNLPPAVKMKAEDQRDVGPYGLDTRVEVVDAATGNLRYRAISHCLSQGPKKSGRIPPLKQTLLEGKHLAALKDALGQLKRGQALGAETENRPSLPENVR